MFSTVNVFWRIVQFAVGELSEGCRVLQVQTLLKTLSPARRSRWNSVHSGWPESTWAPGERRGPDTPARETYTLISHSQNALQWEQWTFCWQIQQHICILELLAMMCVSHQSLMRIHFECDAELKGSYLCSLLALPDWISWTECDQGLLPAV